MWSETRRCSLSIDKWRHAHFSPRKPAKTQDWQSRGVEVPRWVHHNPLIDFHRERRIVPRLITLSGLVPMQPDVGVMERSGDVVDADIADLPEIPRMHASPSNEVFLPDAEVVRPARVEDSGKTGSTRRDFPRLAFREAHPDHNLMRFDRHLLVTNGDNGPRVEVRETSQDGRHFERPVGEGRSHMGPLTRIEFDFIGKLWFDAEDDQFIGFQPAVEVFVVQRPL